MERTRKHKKKKSGVLGLIYISVLVCTQFVHWGLDRSCSKIKFRTVFISFKDKQMGLIFYSFNPLEFSSLYALHFESYTAKQCQPQL